MTEAARRMGVSRTSALRALRNAGTDIQEPTPKAFIVDEKAVAAYIDGRGGADQVKRGRPRKAAPAPE